MGRKQVLFSIPRNSSYLQFQNKAFTANPSWNKHGLLGGCLFCFISCHFMMFKIPLVYMWRKKEKKSSINVFFTRKRCHTCCLLLHYVTLTRNFFRSSSYWRPEACQVKAYLAEWRSQAVNPESQIQETEVLCLLMQLIPHWKDMKSFFQNAKMT